MTNELYTLFMQCLDEHTLPDKDVFFSMNALIGELGELANVFKKREFAECIPDYQQRVATETESGQRESWLDQEIDEAGDVLFYFLQVLRKRGINLIEVMQSQIGKLAMQDAELKRTFVK